MQVLARQGKKRLLFTPPNKYDVDFGDRDGQPFFHTLDKRTAWEIFFGITDEMPDLR